MSEEFEDSYKSMANDKKAEEEASEWIEWLIENDFYEKNRV